MLGDRVSLDLDTLNLKEVVEYFPDPDAGEFLTPTSMPSPSLTPASCRVTHVLVGKPSISAGFRPTRFPSVTPGVGVSGQALDGHGGGHGGVLLALVAVDAAGAKAGIDGRSADPGGVGQRGIRIATRDLKTS
ncbi:hypothetical protein [Saccharopolyspora pogona]|uniref:hypothetical protein n=1 Tax=Saccharopolyspora pogona TaxID=333966 RepID=UPI0021E0F371|nr:hypothetical protein [Saccharopolyspora pogona]